MIKVLDASALLAYLEKESGYEKVKEAFVRAADTDKRLLMSTVNWGEVFYILAKEYDMDKAEEIAALIQTFPIEIISVDRELAKQAAIFKAEKKLPYADCFAITSAQSLDRIYTVLYNLHNHGKPADNKQTGAGRPIHTEPVGAFRAGTIHS